MKKRVTNSQDKINYNNSKYLDFIRKNKTKFPNKIYFNKNYYIKFHKNKI